MGFLGTIVKKSRAWKLRRRLFLAAREGDAVKVSRILASGVDPNAKAGLRGGTALHQAAEKGLTEAARVLLDHGADVNVRDGSGNTPLHGAARMGRTEVAELLLHEGADVNAKNDDGWTPLDQGLLKVQMARLLVDRGAEWTLEVAIMLGDLGKVEELLEAGADVNATGRWGFPPLCWAVFSVRFLFAEGGRVEIIKLLLERGADVNARNGDGDTPLHLAAEQENPEVVKLLLKHGADVNARDRSSLATPLHEAIRYENPEVAELLSAHGGKDLWQSGGDVT